MNARIDYLTLEDLIDFGKFLIPDFRIRDLGLLNSAVVRPQTIIYGREAYPEFAEKVAALMHSLARNQALIDGNKRIAWSAGSLFCIMNHCDLKAPVADAERMVVDLASGALDVSPLTVWLNKHIISW